jgi:hypothetical protein
MFKKANTVLILFLDQQTVVDWLSFKCLSFLNLVKSRGDKSAHPMPAIVEWH